MVIRHIRRIKNKFASIVRSIFRKKKDVKIGLYGPVNSGKTTLANKICMDWLGEELGKASSIPHETREVMVKEKVTVRDNGKSLTFNLVDTPGIATKIDFEDFLKFGMKRKDAKQRAKEATRGVIESIKWLDSMDMVLVVLDSTKSPINQVNITILGNLDARNIPVLIVSNKIDVKRSDTTRIRNAFHGYDVIGVSAKNGDMMNEMYKMLLKKI
ncbi:MAG: GTP-binding protein [Candidatus Aenigmarchaeota archaeon]|nr:GTP-binding protein [Candidatus Aenigmarchaeota archaeon]